MSLSIVLSFLNLSISTGIILLIWNSDYVNHPIKFLSIWDIFKMPLCGFKTLPNLGPLISIMPHSMFHDAAILNYWLFSKLHAYFCFRDLALVCLHLECISPTLSFSSRFNVNTFIKHSWFIDHLPIIEFRCFT